MHLWRKLVDPHWLSAHENPLQARSRGRLVITSRPGRKRLELEIACTSRNDARKLTEEFGGRAEKWPRDWLKRFADLNESKPLKIGTRLVIASSRVRMQCRGGRCPQRIYIRRARPHALRTAHATARIKKPLLLVIPASAAFGTGGHATTAMSLRLLERLTRQWERGWSLADLGTGSGILALAAKHFGAERVTGIDIDPRAISIAKANARLNKIDNADFQLGDIRRWKPGARWDVIAANLYNELLISLVSKLKRSNWLILSGALDRQEEELLRVLQRNNIEIASVKRRGKWIALLACNSPNIQHTTSKAQSFLIRRSASGSSVRR
jgi:ribosomal protein L11 methylase PrmA